MKISGIQIGEGWIVSIYQYTSSKKRGKFYNVFCERPMPDASNTNEMWNFIFCRKDGINDYSYFLYRTQKHADTNKEKWTEKMFLNENLKNHTAPKILIDLLENIDSAEITFTFKISHNGKNEVR